jgi:hypothetical protein
VKIMRYAVDMLPATSITLLYVRAWKDSYEKSPKDWDSADWSDGCVRRTPLECNSGDGFLRHTGVKLPDKFSSWYNKSMSLEECEGMCLKNCSCTAYASLDISEGGSGCVLWFGSLVDIRESAEDGQDLYTKMAPTELGEYHFTFIFLLLLNFIFFHFKLAHNSCHSSF